MKARPLCTLLIKAIPNAAIKRHLVLLEDIATRGWICFSRHLLLIASRGFSSWKSFNYSYFVLLRMLPSFAMPSSQSLLGFYCSFVCTLDCEAVTSLDGLLGKWQQKPIHRQCLVHNPFLTPSPILTLPHYPGNFFSTDKSSCMWDGFFVCHFTDLSLDVLWKEQCL